MKGRLRSGQAAMEYVLVLASIIVVAGILWHLVRAADSHAQRTQGLVTSDCP